MSILQSLVEGWNRIVGVERASGAGIVDAELVRVWLVLNVALSEGKSTWSVRRHATCLKPSLSRRLLMPNVHRLGARLIWLTSFSMYELFCG